MQLSDFYQNRSEANSDLHRIYVLYEIYVDLQLFIHFK